MRRGLTYHRRAVQRRVQQRRMMETTCGQVERQRLAPRFRREERRAELFCKATAARGVSTPRCRERAATYEEFE